MSYQRKKYLPKNSEMLKLKKQFPRIYEWMLEKMPFGCMYERRWIDSQHKMVFPRWGYTNRQHREAKKRAKELMKNINWE